MPHRAPLQLEGWPGHSALEAYESAAGWVRGEGVRPDAPPMLDWLPGARAALEADAEARALLPGWRRATSHAELSQAVRCLLYGGQAPPHHPLAPLLWIPLFYEVFPLECTFVRRELAAGNIWLLPAREGGGFVGVLLLTFYATASRMSAGGAARPAHAAVPCTLPGGWIHSQRRGSRSRRHPGGGQRRHKLGHSDGRLAPAPLPGLRASQPRRGDSRRGGPPGGRRAAATHAPPRGASTATLFCDRRQ
jgi:hypothetical protein